MKEIQAEIGIIAAGPAGLAAAVAAAEKGMSVAVFEKAPIPGGTANMGMGPLGLESNCQKRNLIQITKEEAFKKFMDYVHWEVDARLVREYFWKSGSTIDWLEDMGVQFTAPKKMFGTSEYTWHTVQPDGGGVPGPRAASAMTRILHERAVELGVEFYFECPAQRLTVENGRVVGFVAKNASGEEISVSAHAVILATGGFGNNPEMILEETGFRYGEDLFSFRIPGIDGDGLHMAWAAGAGRSGIHMEKILAFRLPDSILFKHLFEQPNLLVNRAGERICDESMMQNSSVGSNIITRQPGHVAYMILTDRILKEYRRHGMDIPNQVFAVDCTENFEEDFAAALEEYPEEVFYADSLEGLADAMPIDKDEFLRAVEEYNDTCDKHYDDYFCKERRYLKPIRGKKFYAVAIHAGAYGSLGGILVNYRLEVLDPEHHRIPGFYAAGSDVCDIYAGTYMFYLPGNTMGFAVNSGRLAGEHAADFVLAELEEN